MNHKNPPRVLSLALLTVIATVMAACEEEPIRHYPTRKHAFDAHAGHDHPPGHHPTDETSPQPRKLIVTPPAGWEPRTPSGMGEFAAFAKADGDRETKITVSQLVSNPRMLLMVINRWRSSQLGMDPIEQADIPSVIQPAQIADLPAQRITMVGTGDAPLSIDVVMLDLDGATYYLKLMGPADHVAELTGDFETFVANLRVSETQQGGAP